MSDRGTQETTQGSDTCQSTGCLVILWEEMVWCHDRENAVGHTIKHRSALPPFCSLPVGKHSLSSASLPFFPSPLASPRSPLQIPCRHSVHREREEAWRGRGGPGERRANDQLAFRRFSHRLKLIMIDPGLAAVSATLPLRLQLHSRMDRIFSFPHQQFGDLEEEPD